MLEIATIALITMFSAVVYVFVKIFGRAYFARQIAKY